MSYSHDKCPQNIPANGMAYGLTNQLSWTLSRCDCDMVFRKCLSEDKMVNNVLSDEYLAAKDLGKIYFHGTKQCFFEAHPLSETQKCIVKENHFSDGDARCRVYVLNKEQPKKVPAVRFTLCSG